MSLGRQLVFDRVSTVGRWVLLALAAVCGVYERPAPLVSVRWRDGLSADARQQAERQLYLVVSGQPDDRTWRYALLAPTRTNIRAIITHPDAEDTSRIIRENATIAAQAGRSEERVWWVGPLRGVNGPRTFRLTLLAIGLVTLASAALAGQRRSSRSWR